MQPIGFSTGALARGDFRRGLAMQSRLGLGAVELSALRSDELVPLMRALPSLDLREFNYISLHAPSRLDGMTEPDLVSILRAVPSRWPIIVHPDLIKDPSLWRVLGQRLCLENMDQRKMIGRTAAEVEILFEQFPDAGFCFDIGHARQVDPTMGIAINLLQRFRGRLRQVHMSEVDPQGRHIPISFAALCSFQLVAKLIPGNCPVILESMVTPEGIRNVLETAQKVLTGNLGVKVSTDAFNEIPAGL